MRKSGAIADRVASRITTARHAAPATDGRSCSQASAPYQAITMTSSVAPANLPPDPIA